MTTAQARTNQAGYATSGVGSLGDTMCKTDQFVITPSKGSKGVFPPVESLQNYMGREAYFLEFGKLLGFGNDSVQLIAQGIFESTGVNLRREARLMEHKESTRVAGVEIWLDGVRYKQISGRVYGHKVGS